MGGGGGGRTQLHHVSVTVVHIHMFTRLGATAVAVDFVLAAKECP